MAEETPAPAGWYPDPELQGGERWWDGAQWGEKAAAPPPMAPSPRPTPTQPVIPVATPEKRGKPWWRRPWAIALWALLIIIIIASATSSGGDDDASDESSSTIAGDAAEADADDASTSTTADDAEATSTSAV